MTWKALSLFPGDDGARSEEDMLGISGQSQPPGTGLHLGHVSFVLLRSTAFSPCARPFSLLREN